MESPFSLLYLVIILLSFLQLNTISVSRQCLQDQQLSLLRLKQSLVFDAEFSTKVNTWDSSTDCCAWSGVTCNGGRVIGLNLSMESIIGGLENSSGLFSLQFLRNLDLSFNKFSTTLPANFDNLTNLMFLNLSNAGFKGQIPYQISSLSKLVSLDLSMPNFLGVSSLKLENPNLATIIRNLTLLIELRLDGVNISAHGNEWCRAISSSLTHLQVLSLSNCSLSGLIHPSLAQLKSLSVIRLSNNNFSGPVPEFLGNFTNLTVLELWFCELSGTFPEGILLLPKLQLLDISNNHFLQGYIPEFHENLFLQTIVLSYTNFSGTLPQSIGSLERLSRIELVNCSLIGPIPSSMANLMQLVYLDFSTNMFTGSIPSFGMSKNLTYINLSYNKLTGEISSAQWEDLQRLEYFDVRYNALNGTIPSTLLAIPSVQQILLCFNQFGGQVPEFVNPYLSSLNTLDLSSNKLEGSIPKSIFDLGKLNVLLLPSNTFNGTIKLALFGKLGNLTTLDLSYNRLTVDARASNSTLSSFSQIKTLKLASCNLREFPHLSSQAELFHLDLSVNQINGLVPLWVWNGSLQHLNLSGNHLVGLQEPKSLSFSSLYVLDLSNNQIQGSIPTPFASYVDFSNNNFTFIPNDIGNYFYQAVFLSVSNNRFTGGIPASICNASYLQVLDLSNNNLNGTIPSCLIERLDALRVLNLRMNKFEGYIPDSFSGICGLRTLDLSGNLLRGGIRKSLVNCSTLQVLNLRNNMLIDVFPCHLKNLSNLHVLDLRRNKFFGGIGCSEDGRTWPRLQIVDIASNNFSGKIPLRLFLSWKAMMRDGNDAYDQLKFKTFEFTGPYYRDSITVTSKGHEMQLVKILIAFTSIDFSCNKFQGPIPEFIGNFSALYALNLSHNALCGPIPSCIGNLLHLESLDLSVNSLSGTIPQQLADLTFLSFLNLSNNHLTGKIPAGSQLQTFDADSFEGNEGLYGLPLKDKNSPEPPPKLDHSTSGEDINWTLIGAELGYVFGFGIVVGPLVFWKRWRRRYYKHVDNVLFRIFPKLGSRNHKRRAPRNMGSN